MISLLLPPNTQNYYFAFGNMLWGPIGSDFRFPKASSMRKSSDDRFAQSKDHLYHEHDVSHTRIDGTIVYTHQSTDFSVLPYYIAGATTSQAIQVQTTKNGVVSSFPCVIGRAWHYRLLQMATLGFSASVYLPFIMDNGLPGFYYLNVDPYQTNKVRFARRYYVNDIRPATYNREALRVTRTCELFDPPSGHSIETKVDWSSNYVTSDDVITLFNRLTLVSVETYPGDEQMFSTPAPCIDPDQLLRDILSNASFSPSGLPKEKPYGELAAQAIEKINVNQVNMIAFLRDLRHPTEMIPKLTALKEFKALSKVKSLANDYLAVNYGILPTQSDLQNIWKAVKKVKPYVDRNGFSTFSASFRDILFESHLSYTTEQHIKVAVENEDVLLKSITNAIDKIGFLPTFKNLWDLIPYSFVLDWFIDIGEYLKRVDTRLHLLRLKIPYVTMSNKVTSQIDLSFLSTKLPISGNLKRVDYHRWTTNQCPLPPFSLPTSPTGSFNHWLESGALIIQRRK